MKLISHLYLSKNIIKQHYFTDSLGKQFSFMIGNLWPDLNLSFLSRPHLPELWMDDVTDLIDSQLHLAQQGAMSYFQLGKLCHYLADFFCGVHNDLSDKQLIFHRRYEKQLHDVLLSFDFNHYPTDTLPIHEPLYKTLQIMREEYLQTQVDHSRDSIFITQICFTVTLSICKINQIIQENEPQATQAIPQSPIIP